MFCIASSVNLGSRRVSLSNGTPATSSEEENLIVWYFFSKLSIRHSKGAWLGPDFGSIISFSNLQLTGLGSFSLTPPSRYK